LGTGLNRSSSKSANEDEKVIQNERKKKQGDRNVVGALRLSLRWREQKNWMSWKVSRQSLLVLLEKVNWKQVKESGNEEGSVTEVDCWQ